MNGVGIRLIFEPLSASLFIHPFTGLPKVAVNYVHGTQPNQKRSLIRVNDILNTPGVQVVQDGAKSASVSLPTKLEGIPF
jgi:hypothetical protein